MNDPHELQPPLSRVRAGALRFLAAIGPKQDDPAPPPPALRAAWGYLALIGPKPEDPAPPPPDHLRAVLAHTRRMIEAIGPKQDDPLARAIFAGAVARFADEIGPKQDDPHHPHHDPELRAFRAWAIEYVTRAAR